VYDLRRSASSAELAGVAAVGYDEKEVESWEMARQSALDGYNVEL
jgi:hypothetical protein